MPRNESVADGRVDADAPVRRAPVEQAQGEVSGGAGERTRCEHPWETDDWCKPDTRIRCNDPQTDPVQLRHVYDFWTNDMSKWGLLAAQNGEAEAVVQWMGRWLRALNGWAWDAYAKVPLEKDCKELRARYDHMAAGVFDDGNKINKRLCDNPPEPPVNPPSAPPNCPFR